MSKARVLHLIDGRPDTDPVPTTLALLAMSRRVAAPDDRVLLLGGAGVDDAAAAAGLEDYQRLGVPFGSAVSGQMAVRRALRVAGPFDLVHAWSPGALRFAGRVMGDVPAVLTVARTLNDRERRQVSRQVWRQANRRVVMIDPTWQSGLVEAGLSEEACRVSPPAFDPALTIPNRAAVRERWGVDDRAVIVALLDPPPCHADAMRIALGIGLPTMRIEAQSGSDTASLFRLVMHPKQHRRPQARQLVTDFGSPDFLRQDAELAAPWKVLAGCDAIVVTGGGGAALPWAMVAGVPIIADSVGLAGEVLTHDVTALFTGDEGHRGIAHQFSRLMADPALARSIADHARAEAEARFGLRGYRDALARTYRGVLGSHESV